MLLCWTVNYIRIHPLQFPSLNSLLSFAAVLTDLWLPYFRHCKFSFVANRSHTQSRLSSEFLMQLVLSALWQVNNLITQHVITSRPTQIRSIYSPPDWVRKWFADFIATISRDFPYRQILLQLALYFIGLQWNPVTLKNNKFDQFVDIP